MPDTLRSATIRLAHDHPDLRAELLPILLRTAKGPSYESYVERKKSKGETPLPKDKWESRVLGKGNGNGKPKSDPDEAEDKPKGKGDGEGDAKSEDAPKAAKFEGFMAKLKEKASGLSKSVMDQLHKASDEVKAFVSDPEHRKATMKAAAKSLRKQPKVIAGRVKEAAVEYLHEHTKALQAVVKIARRKKLDRKDKVALFHAGLTIVMGAIGASAGGLPGAAGAIGKTFAKYVVANAVHRTVGKANVAAEAGEATHHLGEGVLHFLGGAAVHASDRSRVAAEVSEDDSMNLFSNLLVASVIQAMEQGLSEEDVIAALEDKMPEGASGYGDPPEGKGKEASLRAATIRLAAARPDLRPHLLPILKGAGMIEMVDGDEVDTSTARIRKILRRAAGLTTTRVLKSWLLNDEMGGWEKTVRELLTESAPKARELGMTAEQVDEATASHVFLLGAEAVIRDVSRDKAKVKRR